MASSQQKPLEDEAIASGADVKASPRRKSTSFLFPISDATEEDYSSFEFDGVVDGPVGNWSPFDGNIGNGKLELDNALANDLEWENILTEPVTAKADKESESEDFYDPGESASFTSNTDAGEEGSHRLATPVGEFYDAWNRMFLTLFFSCEMAVNVRILRVMSQISMKAYFFHVFVKNLKRLTQRFDLGCFCKSNLTLKLSFLDFPKLSTDSEM